LSGSTVAGRASDDACRYWPSTYPYSGGRSTR